MESTKRSLFHEGFAAWQPVTKVPTSKVALGRRRRRVYVPEPLPRTFHPFLSLPGEIRNEIYGLLIDSTIASKSNISNGKRNLRPTFNITALPRWTGSPLIRFLDIGSLPALFVNQQLYREISPLLYSRVENLTLGGYVLQHRDEDPTERWRNMFNALERRPGLLNTVQQVTIRLPSAREDLLKGYWLSHGLLTPRDKAVPPNLMAGIPSLTKFLGSFGTLGRVKIVVTVEEREPPDFKPLLQLWDVCGSMSEVEFVVPVWDRKSSTA